MKYHRPGTVYDSPPDFVRPEPSGMSPVFKDVLCAALFLVAVFCNVYLILSLGPV